MLSLQAKTLDQYHILCYIEREFDVKKIEVDILSRNRVRVRRKRKKPIVITHERDEIRWTEESEEMPK